MFEKYAFQNSPLSQLIFDPFEDQIIDINDSAASLLWGVKNELIGNSLSAYFREQWYNLINFTQSTLEQGKSHTMDISISSFDKKQARDIEINACTVHWQQKRKPYIHLFIQDIFEIERKQALANANKHFFSGLTHWQQVALFFKDIERDNQLILNAVGEGIYGVDAKGRTTFVNEVAEELLGWTANELVGKEIHDIIHHTHEDGSTYHKHCCPIYAAFQDGAVHHQVDEFFWKKDQSSIPVEYTSTPLRDGTQLVGAVVVFRDVSRRKKAEKSLMAAIKEVETLKFKLEQENAYLQEEILINYNHHKIVGSTPVIQKVIQQIELVGPTNASVLITGESGTGKELVARAIHDASNRSERPMIRVNCAAIPRDIFESEFFGHVKGAFTGATSDRIGRFELADGGTLFLDEIGELSYDLQSKLLRVLQEQQFERVGETKTRNIDVRVVAATNQNLKSQIENKEFREDLYFRLNVFPVEVPALRERKDDIKPLTMYFLDKIRRNFNRPELQISIAQIEKLHNYAWPGNIRELQNVIERQAIVATSNQLTFNNLFDATNDKSMANTASQTQAMTENEYINSDKKRIITALISAQGKVFGKNGAAEILQVKPTTLSSRLKKYQIDPKFYKAR